MTQAAWPSHYVGLPFADDGLDRRGLHCWGLVRLVLAEQHGIDLPDHGECSAADLVAAARHFAGDSNVPPWVKVESAFRAFDVVLMSAMTDAGGRSRRLPGHCGILADSKTVLHIWSKTDAVLMPLDHPRIRFQVLSFHRHRDLA